MELKKDYTNWLEARGLQPRTIKEYEYCLEHLDPKLTQQTVDDYIRKHKGNVAKSFIRSFKNFLLRNPEAYNISLEDQSKIRLIDVPTVKSRKRKTPKIITEEEMHAIFHKMPNEETKLMLLLSFYCGLRRDELLNLRFNMFNWSKWNGPDQVGILTIIGKGGKEGIIPVKGEIMQQVFEYYSKGDKEEKDLIFDVKSRTWARKLSKASTEAIGKHVKPHTLRHSIAMHLRGSNFSIDEIKEFLRHEDISTTQIYSRVTPEQLMEKFDDL